MVVSAMLAHAMSTPFILSIRHSPQLELQHLTNAMLKLSYRPILVNGHARLSNEVR